MSPGWTSRTLPYDELRSQRNRPFLKPIIFWASPPNISVVQSPRAAKEFCHLSLILIVSYSLTCILLSPNLNFRAVGEGIHVD